MSTSTCVAIDIVSPAAGLDLAHGDGLLGLAAGHVSVAGLPGLAPLT